MIFRRHIPSEPLARFVDWLWFYEDFNPTHRREHVLPDGTFELVIDLREGPRKVFDREREERYNSVRRGWLSGAHAEYLVIDALPRSSMIGAHFKPGGAAAVLGRPADELRDEVVELDAIWGPGAWELREQLLAARGSEAKFQLLEEFLLGRWAQAGTDAMRAPRVDWALTRFLAEPSALTIGDVVDDLGISHKHFIEQFRAQVGLTPKLFCRIRRFQEVLAKIASQQSIEWADIACDCGYFDQPHFVRDFQAFAGLNPTRYLTHRLEDPKFVALDDGR